jgi:hypothetical protein
MAPPPQPLDGLQVLRRNLRRAFLAESRKHKAAKLLRQIHRVGTLFHHLPPAIHLPLGLPCAALCR